MRNECVPMCAFQTKPMPNPPNPWAHPLLQALQPSPPSTHSSSDTQASTHTAGSEPAGKAAHSARSTLPASRLPLYCLPDILGL